MLVVAPIVTPVGQPSVETPTATSEVRKNKGETLEVDPDTESEKAEHEDGSTWFILRETRQRFLTANENFRVAAQ